MFKERQHPPRSAFVLGTAFFIVFAALICGFAFARPQLYPAFTAGDTSFEQSPPETREKPQVRQPSNASARGQFSAGVGGNAVCVRLCDGFFFPAADPAGTDASCQAQCPDAPMSLYLKSGDDINDAVSLAGAKYTDLSVADRYQTTFDKTCVCRRNPSGDHRAALAKDRILRSGDVMMTANGFLVAEANKLTGSLGFVALAQATSITKDVRTELTAMEQGGRPAEEGIVDARLTVRPVQLRQLPDRP